MKGRSVLAGRQDSRFPEAFYKMFSHNFIFELAALRAGSNDNAPCVNGVEAWSEKFACPKSFRR